MSKDSVIYVRDQDVFRMLTKLVRGRSIFLESHQKPNDISKFKPAFERASGVVVITKYYEKELRDMGLRKVLCAPDGVKIEHFDIDISRDDARKKLGLPLGKKLVVYTGHLYPWKGANTLADSANVIDMDTLIVFVGGADNDLDDFKKRYGMVKNILILGQKPHAEIPLYLKAADVVVIPNTSRENISRLYTSPIKLFEYMASGRPIIVSDLPSMRDVLSENNAVFATPDDPQSFAEAITNTLKNVELIQKISTEARRDVEKYSWDIRARNILAFIDLNSKNILQV